MIRYIPFILALGMVYSCTKTAESIPTPPVPPTTPQYRVKSVNVDNILQHNFHYNSANQLAIVTASNNPSNLTDFSLVLDYMPNSIHIDYANRTNEHLDYNLDANNQLKTILESTYFHSIPHDITYGSNGRIESIARDSGYGASNLQSFIYSYNNTGLESLVSITEDGDSMLTTATYTNGRISSFGDHSFDYTNGRLHHWYFTTADFKRTITFTYDPVLDLLSTIQDETIWTRTNPPPNSSSTVTFAYEALPGVFPDTWRSQLQKDLGLPVELRILADFYTVLPLEVNNQ